MKRYQIILATMIILTSVAANNFRSDETKADWPLEHTYLTEMSSIGVFTGLVALVMSGFDVSFALGLTFAAAAAITAAALFQYGVVMILKRYRSDDLRRELAVIASGDFVRSFTFLSMSYVIFNLATTLNIDVDDIC